MKAKTSFNFAYMSHTHAQYFMLEVYQRRTGLPTLYHPCKHMQRYGSHTNSQERGMYTLLNMVCVQLSVLLMARHPILRFTSHLNSLEQNNAWLAIHLHNYTRYGFTWLAIGLGAYQCTASKLNVLTLKHKSTIIDVALQRTDALANAKKHKIYLFPHPPFPFSFQLFSVVCLLFPWSPYRLMARCHRLFWYPRKDGTPVLHFLGNIALP